MIESGGSYDTDSFPRNGEILELSPVSALRVNRDPRRL